ncbi:ABC transporter ATP-binding protein [Allorhizocola rhizosphaerae]|uniref:ABC transporter ATP-binding protein n=1 Tax=Allorhizocola rhizosphaerae TaxID=1872709 RepID=UPI000E3CB037|nr:ATP-binding cassette domain-containing protein [Allorhizocola rhizosphaerae]
MKSIVFNGLTKAFGNRTVVQDLSFTAEPGRVTGFLGPNGAGKTTSLRVLLGLERATAGTATFGGSHYAAMPTPARNVGAVLEESRLHPGRTGRSHLRIHAVSGGIGRERVEEVLGQTGLADVAHRRVKSYSQGMAKRLAIATALLGDPEVLILDEPTNGLDPFGVRWLRDEMRKWANEGRVVLVSSHLLAEMELIVDDVVIIAAGRLLEKADVATLRGADGTSLEDVFIKLAGGGAGIR